MHREKSQVSQIHHNYYYFTESLVNIVIRNVLFAYMIFSPIGEELIGDGTGYHQLSVNIKRRGAIVILFDFRTLFDVGTIFNKRYNYQKSLINDQTMVVK